MQLHPARLRRGEWLVGASAVALAVSLFATNWYGLKARLAPTARQLGRATALTGWDALTHVRWLLAIAVLAAFALVIFQAGCRAPAIPASLSVLVTVLGILSLLALIYRVLISIPGSRQVIEVRAGAYLGLISALALSYGAYLSMREEWPAAGELPGEVETVKLEEPPGPSP